MIDFKGQFSSRLLGSGGMLICSSSIQLAEARFMPPDIAREIYSFVLFANAASKALFRRKLAENLKPGLIPPGEEVTS